VRKEKLGGATKIKEMEPPFHVSQSFSITSNPTSMEVFHNALGVREYERLIGQASYASVTTKADTKLFAAVAEVLVKHVDQVIPAGGNIKFVGFTLFALVPSVTEFVQAMATDL
jgi:hypothetical protein